MAKPINALMPSARLQNRRNMLVDEIEGNLEENQMMQIEIDRIEDELSDRHDL